MKIIVPNVVLTKKLQVFISYMQKIKVYEKVLVEINLTIATKVTEVYLLTKFRI